VNSVWLFGATVKITAEAKSSVQLGSMLRTYSSMYPHWRSTGVLGTYGERTGITRTYVAVRKLVHTLARGSFKF
jgi:hypothetical protein